MHGVLRSGNLSDARARQIGALKRDQAVMPIRNNILLRAHQLAPRVCSSTVVYRVQLFRSDRPHNARKAVGRAGANRGMDLLGRVQPHQHRSAFRHRGAGTMYHFPCVCTYGSVSRGSLINQGLPDLLLSETPRPRRGFLFITRKEKSTSTLWVVKLRPFVRFRAVDGVAERPLGGGNKGYVRRA